MCGGFLVVGGGRWERMGGVERGDRGVGRGLSG